MLPTPATALEAPVLAAALPVERCNGLGVSTGVKIMILYMLIGVGMSLSGGWLTEAAGIGTSPNPSMTGFDVMGAAL
jgi:hypothetical protein